MEFGEAVRLHRERLGLSQAEAARRVPMSGAHLSRVEGGGPCSAGTAQAIDTALGADGTLVSLRPAPGQLDPQELLRRESERLADMLSDARPGELVTQIGQATERLSVDYLANPGPGLAEELATARRRAVDALRARRIRHHDQVRDLTLQIGYLSGVMAYCALDSGHPDAALVHARAAWEAAEKVNSDQLRAWVRGTESLIRRFQGDYASALDSAEDGLRYATSGSSRARLLAGVAQCLSHDEDAIGTRRALNDAEVAFERQRGMDELGGLFSFSQAKLFYYSGSSLIWLPGRADARRARTQASAAIDIWKHAGPERSVADEALAHVYASTASLQLHDLEAAAVDLDPILSLPADRRISWIVKRMDRITALLRRPPFDTDPAAKELLDRIRDYQ